MNSGSTVLAQLLSHLPRHTFRKFVDRYKVIASLRASASARLPGTAHTMKIAERNDQREEKRREEKRREEKRREEKRRILFAGKAGSPFRDIAKESPFRLEAQGNQFRYAY